MMMSFYRFYIPSHIFSFNVLCYISHILLYMYVYTSIMGFLIVINRDPPY